RPRHGEARRRTFPRGQTVFAGSREAARPSSSIRSESTPAPERRSLLRLVTGELKGSPLSRARQEPDAALHLACAIPISYARRARRSWRYWAWYSEARRWIIGEHGRFGVGGDIHQYASNNENGYDSGDDHAPRPIGAPRTPPFVGTGRSVPIFEAGIWHVW